MKIAALAPQLRQSGNLAHGGRSKDLCQIFSLFFEGRYSGAGEGSFDHDIRLGQEFADFADELAPVTLLSDLGVEQSLERVDAKDERRQTPAAANGSFIIGARTQHPEGSPPIGTGAMQRHQPMPK